MLENLSYAAGARMRAKAEIVVPKFRPDRRDFICLASVSLERVLERRLQSTGNFNVWNCDARVRERHERLSELEYLIQIARVWKSTTALITSPIEPCGN
jgi:hypothetical protein